MAKRVNRRTIKKVKRSVNNVLNKEKDEVVFGFLAAFLSIIGFIIALAFKKDNKYVMHYAKLSLVIFIIGAIFAVIVIAVKPILIIGEIIYTVLYLVWFVLWLMSWIFALTGEIREIPIISDYAKKLKF